MSDSNDISNNSGPGSAAEPSMEEILASIRRILKEDEGARTTTDDTDEDEDVLVLDASMIVAPADISTATELPVDTGLIAAHDEAPLTTYHEPVHFTSETSIYTQAYEETPAAPEPVQLAEHEDYHEDHEEHEVENVMQDHVQSPDGLISDDATSEIANTIGSLVRSISTERAVSISRGGVTIEDIVREEIRPVLKAWFDTHLPSLVERIVRAEIGRVIDRSQA
ncbi:MAG TPA: DUF2497 domain-containing protein [Acidocella sp.]|nr:DUF2497 domain-containing protein [Acidocella sp.]